MPATPNNQFFQVTRIYQKEEENGTTILKEQPYVLNRSFVASFRPSNALGEYQNGDTRVRHRATLMVGTTEVHVQEKFSDLQGLIGVA